MENGAIVIDFAGEPVAKGRPRFASRGGGHPIAYSPAKTRHFEAALQYAARQEMIGKILLVGPLTMSVVASLPIPQSWSKKKKAQALAGTVLPATKPDVDNYAKLAMDALNGVVFLDDKQITFLMVSKTYAERPSLRIEVTPVSAEAAA